MCSVTELDQTHQVLLLFDLCHRCDLTFDGFRFDPRASASKHCMAGDLSLKWSCDAVPVTQKRLCNALAQVLVDDWFEQQARFPAESLARLQVTVVSSYLMAGAGVWNREEVSW